MTAERTADEALADLREARRRAEALGRDLAPLSEAMDAAEAFDPGLLELLARHEVWRAVHGDDGRAARLAAQCAWIEAIAARCTSTAVLVQSQGTVAHTLLLSKSTDAFALVARMRRGELCGWALTEPAAGSDVLAMSTRARRAGDGYVISGEKRFITNVGMASHYLVFARTGEARSRAALSAFLVPADASGLRVSRKEAKMGLRASPTGDLTLDEVRVGRSALIGAEGDGLALALDTLRWSRPLIAAVSHGVGRGIYEETRRVVAGDSEQAARLVSADQGAAHGLASLTIELAASEALLYRVALDADRRAALPEVWEASASKAYSSDLAMRAAVVAIDLCGWEAATRRSSLERRFRDAKILQIFEGTNEIQLNAIARNLPTFPHQGTAG
jgi:alkylation response protein AidB-like acyl-CoA dehydrogenase